MTSKSQSNEEFLYKQRALTKEFRENFEKIYGKRCPKHPRSRIDDHPCVACQYEGSKKK